MDLGEWGQKVLFGKSVFGKSGGNAETMGFSEKVFGKERVRISYTDFPNNFPNTPECLFGKGIIEHFPNTFRTPSKPGKMEFC